ncbi:hypothetical protein [Microbacterium sp. VKM Ac-2923]|uniref:hypothetical protein n=1 Tax=Microbacterium sp. VKM Ac-2923 TaxID=2929476 RepID=UPI001FB2334A|nr:hypothetical protein [Microbacterium sp. VKM Ac-2923]MCJ1706905.1 hypothetical protein [Microbacterium sp. VKM Ac-2923]
MLDSKTLADLMQDWGSPLVAAIIGAVVGGLVTLAVGSAQSRQARRERYGQTLLDALGRARMHVQRAMSKLNAAGEGAALDVPVVLQQEARDIWVNAHLAGTVERSKEGRRAISGWALHHDESLLGGSYRFTELEWMNSHLQLGEYLVTAWMAREAPGRDFKLSRDDALLKYAPRYREGDVPLYAGPH